jgi:hypothetical protein
MGEIHPSGHVLKWLVAMLEHPPKLQEPYLFETLSTILVDADTYLLDSLYHVNPIKRRNSRNKQFTGGLRTSLSSSNLHRLQRVGAS